MQIFRPEPHNLCVLFEFSGRSLETYAFYVNFQAEASTLMRFMRIFRPKPRNLCVLCEFFSRTPMWAHSNVGALQCGRTPMWAYSNVGVLQCGRTPMWARSNVGALQCGRTPMWTHSNVGNSARQRHLGSSRLPKIKKVMH